MYPRWYRVLQVGSVVAFVMMMMGLVALRLFGPRAPADPEEREERDAPPPVRRPCRGWQLLVSHGTDGHPRRAYVRATIDREEVALRLDSGSATSYVRVPLEADRSSERMQRKVRVGAEVRELPGRRGLRDEDPWDTEARGGLPIAGNLGAEELLGGTTELDLAGGCLARHPRGFALDEATRWPEVPFSVVNGVIVTRVEFDGAATPALFDTGVGNSILVTEAFRPYVDHQVVHDVRGHPIDLYTRSGTVRWGAGPTESGWLERTPRFDTFYDMKLGDVHAMVGITAMGLRKIVVDPARKVLLVGPREP
jgi:hypothetical protein